MLEQKKTKKTKEQCPSKATFAWSHHGVIRKCIDETARRSVSSSGFFSDSRPIGRFFCRPSVLFLSENIRIDRNFTVSLRPSELRVLFCEGGTTRAARRWWWVGRRWYTTDAIVEPQASRVHRSLDECGPWSWSAWSCWSAAPAANSRTRAPRHRRRRRHLRVSRPFGASAIKMQITSWIHRAHGISPMRCYWSHSIRKIITSRIGMPTLAELYAPRCGIDETWIQFDTLRCVLIVDIAFEEEH